MSKGYLRICIRTADIIAIEDCSQRTASSCMADMKVFFKKENKHFRITFKEYAKYRGIPLEDLDYYRK
jgi:hypothetical protein